MRALLLAAGIGSRLRPITDHTPKCLVEIHGRPLLGLWLDRLFAGGIERVLVNTHHLAPQVERFVGASPWRSRVDLVHEPALLGTAGTVVANRNWLGSGPFLLAHADNLTGFDLPGLMAAHAARPPHCVLSMLAFRTDDARSCGILELDADNVVQGFHEKVADPPGDLANAAVYIVERPVVEFARSLNQGTLDFSTEVIPAFIGRIQAVRTAGYHRDIGTPDSLRRARAEFTRPID